MKRSQIKKRKLGAYEIDKISLPYSDDKRYVLDGGVYTLSFFTKIVPPVVIIQNIVIIEKDCDN